MKNVLKRLGLVALFAVGSPALFAAEKDAIVLSDSMTATATVVGIKQKEREITLREPAGGEFTVVAGDAVRNFKQIKKGDTVVVEYRAAVASTLEKASDATVAGAVTSGQRANAGSKPGMVAQHTETIVATVLAIDTKQRLLTAQGPHGGVVTVKVPVEIKAFDSLKKGDKISAVYSVAVAMSVKAPEKKK